MVTKEEIFLTVARAPVGGGEYIILGSRGEPAKGNPINGWDYPTAGLATVVECTLDNYMRLFFNDRQERGLVETDLLQFAKGGQVWLVKSQMFFERERVAFISGDENRAINLLFKRVERAERRINRFRGKFVMDAFSVHGEFNNG